MVGASPSTVLNRLSLISPEEGAGWIIIFAYSFEVTYRVKGILHPWFGRAWVGNVSERIFLFCSVWLYLVLFSCTANVHRICEEFQIHLSKCPAHDQLHAAHTDRDVCPGHTYVLPACLHLYPSACHSLAQCNDNKEEGRYPSVWKECILLWGMCKEGKITVAVSVF